MTQKLAKNKKLQDLSYLSVCVLFFRANASLNLESQIKKVDGLVSAFEKKLSEDGPIPDVPNAIKSQSQDIQVRKSSFAFFQNLTSTT